jgi:hypothetical protein
MLRDVTHCDQGVLRLKEVQKWCIRGTLQKIAFRISNPWDIRYTEHQKLCIAGLQTAAGGASIVHSFIATSRLLLFYVRHPPIISPSHSPSYRGGGPHSCYCISCNVVPIIRSKLIACVQQGIYAELLSVRLNYCTDRLLSQHESQ